MTVAPMIPMATTIIPAWRRLGVNKATPISAKLGLGLGKNENFDEEANGDCRHEQQR